MKIYFKQPFVKVRHSQTGMNVVYSKYSNRIAVLGDKASTLFNLITDNDEVVDISEVNLELFSREFVLQTINRLVESSILFLTENDLREGDFSKEISTSFGLETAYLHPTMQCNLNCKYCYNKEVLGKTDEMSAEQWMQVIDKLLGLALKNIVITGGEPTLYDDLIALIGGLKQRNLNVSLISNGTNMEKIVPIADDLDQIIISMDSEKNHINKLTRVGVEKYSVFDNLPLLERYKEKVIINAVVTKDNLSQMDHFQNVIESKGMRFRRMRFTARNSSQVKNMTYDIIYPNDKTYVFHRQRYRCHAGAGVIAITANGDVYPCQTMLENAFRMTNVYVNDWIGIIKTHCDEESIIGKSYESFQRCKECEFEYICCGGCPSERYQMTGSLKKMSDQECGYMKECAIKYLENIRVRRSKGK